MRYQGPDLIYATRILRNEGGMSLQRKNSFVVKKKKKVGVCKVGKKFGEFHS